MARRPEDFEVKTSVSFQKRLTSIIDENDCGRKEFAVYAGVNKEVITRAVVYGIIPSVKSLIKIADKIGVSIEYLLGESEDKIFYKAEKPTSFHERIKQLTEERGIKFSELSNKMPFAKNSIYEWMRTKGLPSLEYLKIMAGYFGVTVDYLLGRTDDRE